MKSADALHEFERFLKSRGASVNSVSVPDGIDAMIEFYRDTRADDCALDSDGDMLLFQWGTYDWGDGPRFEVEITRQFIRDGGEDEDIWQLSLTFVCSPTAIASGNRWCAMPSDLSEFAKFVRSHSAYVASVPLQVELNFEPAG